MIKKIEGIVISETNYGESSKIINILTKELGIIGVISKGCRKIKSSLRSVSNKLVYGEFNVFYKENKLSNLISVDVKYSFRNICKDIISISYSTYILDLVVQIYNQNNDEKLFDLLIQSLTKIDEGFSPNIIANIMELKGLDYLGISPNFDCCSLCGDTKNIVSLSAKNGGYICKNCITNEVIVSNKSVKVIRLLYYADLNKITKLELSNQTIKEIDCFLRECYDNYTGVYLKSKKFLNTLNF